MEKNSMELSGTQKGIIYFIGGLFLLLYAVNIIGPAFNIIVILGAVAVIMYGLFLAHVPQYIMNIFKRMK